MSGAICLLLATTAVLIAAVALPIKMILFIGIAITAIRFWQQYGTATGRHFIRQLMRADTYWLLETGDAALRRAQLIDSYTHVLITILCFRLATGGVRAVTILPDAADAETRRRLRVWLRMVFECDHLRD